ncbi:MAG: endolytic transglycosylase MltG [Nevskiales bacterium]
MYSRTALLFSVVVSLLLGCACLVAIDAFRALNQPLTAAANSTQEAEEVEAAPDFAVEEGDSLAAIANRLYQQKRLDYARDRRYLSWAGRLSGYAGEIHVGEYDLTKHNSAWNLLLAMVAGDVIQYSFTIIEGWNIHQVLTALAANTKVTQTEPALTPQSLAKALALNSETAEGWLLPDTYLFPKGITDLSVLKRAYAGMQKTLETAWAQRVDALPYKNAYEALIMASIIEKETAVAAERRQIAGVFVRRLQKGMLLQTDPTVIYGIGPDFDGNIRRTDLRKDTPYNTYTRSGLPPTPIAMPGKASIEAALDPADGQSLYFVSRGDGTHVFSETLQQHNAAVDRYQRKKAKPETPPTTPAEQPAEGGK